MTIDGQGWPAGSQRGSADNDLSRRRKNIVRVATYIDLCKDCGGGCSDGSSRESDGLSANYEEATGHADGLSVYGCWNAARNHSFGAHDNCSSGRDGSDYGTPK